jgi:hypothetical protein
MRQHAEGMPVAEGAVLQQVALRQEDVDRLRDLGAAGTGLQKAHPIVMGGDIGLPDGAAGVVDLTDEKRPLQRGVVARDHREGVEAQDIAPLQDAPRDRVVRAVGVDARLEPDPGVAVFGLRKAPRDLQFHSVASGHGHVDLPRAFADRVADRVAAQVRHLGPRPDQRDLGGGFVHPAQHGGLRHVDDAGGARKASSLPFCRSVR